RHEPDQPDGEHDRAHREIMLKRKLVHHVHVSGYAFCRGLKVPTTGMLCGLSSIGVAGAVNISVAVSGSTVRQTRRRAMTIAPTIATVSRKPASSRFTSCVRKRYSPSC